jgi:hypothetical protein
MSDHGDYKEPKAGDWMVVIAPESGEVACLKVLSIGFNNEVAAMSDGSAWAVETGAPLHRKWSECHLWSFDSSFARYQIEDLLGGASESAVAEVYGILLADRESRNKTPV